VLSARKTGDNYVPIMLTLLFAKELVNEVGKTTKVLEITGMSLVYERLETMQQQLILCEKALAEYLETKRLAFPRFYFVSSADLLDILSNGNSPTAVSILYILLNSVAFIVNSVKCDRLDESRNELKVQTSKALMPLLHCLKYV
jgi:hypothetical protein